MANIVSDIQGKIKSLSDVTQSTVRKSAGRIVSCNDGIITVEGLP